jgi:ribosomal protein S18 acetylase RimI-like enzyme
MKIEEIRAQYDREQRRDIVWPDAVREALPHVVRHITRDGKRGFVLYSDLDTANADGEIAAQLEFFRTQDIPFEWKLFSHDRPADLRTRLARQGIETDEEEAVMVLDLSAGPPLLQLQPTADVRRITEPGDLVAVAVIEEAIWGRSFVDQTERLRVDMVNAPESLAVYLAYVAGAPVAAGWTYFHTGTGFASIWGGSTLPEYRGRGLYSALLAARARDAQERGYRFLTVDAGPMSKPILARHGFVEIAVAYPCEWTPERSEIMRPA